LAGGALAVGFSDLTTFSTKTTDGAAVGADDGVEVLPAVGTFDGCIYKKKCI
jgi:hypothetical protein